MNNCPDVMGYLVADEGVLALIGSSKRILSGTAKMNTNFSPPLLFVDVLKGSPVLEGESGILADTWDCIIGIMIEGYPEELAEAVSSAMEKQGFTCAGTKREPLERPEWSSLTITYRGTRMRA